jgi:hypothetical protein
VERTAGKVAEHGGDAAADGCAAARRPPAAAAARRLGERKGRAKESQTYGLEGDTHKFRLHASPLTRHPVEHARARRPTLVAAV